MKTRLAAGLALIAVAAVIALVLAPDPLKPAAPLPPPQPRPAVPQASARDVVVAYLEALYRKDYRAAYDHLSADSRRAHPYHEYLDLCERGEITDFDVEAAYEKHTGAGATVIAVPLAEDPAEAGFVAVREGGEWKVVFIQGVPWFPYAATEPGPT
jgi:hypothetical protein